MSSDAIASAAPKAPVSDTEMLCYVLASLQAAQHQPAISAEVIEVLCNVLVAHVMGPRPRSCRVCGCTDDDCRVCVQATGVPCSWVELDLCSRCAAAAAAPPPAPAGEWAIVELFGYRRLAGRVREVLRYGQPFMELATPGQPPQCYAGKAIYSVTPSTEAAVLAFYQRNMVPLLVEGEEQPAIDDDRDQEDGLCC